MTQFDITKSILNVSPKSIGLTNTQKNILLHLSFYFGQHFDTEYGGSFICFPSVSTISLKCGSKSDDVSKALHKCEELGYLRIVKRTTEGGKNLSNIYVWLGISESVPTVKETKEESPPMIELKKTASDYGISRATPEHIDDGKPY
ncbi:hypothetical protein [Vibrio sp. 10N.222.55.C7]|uniref:hypothetical protein n=1 Tax=Vibrio sp. 10N.222.55.C7 TaxID=3229650 RepID=UPI00354F994C